MPITQSQGQALTALIGQLRKDWDLAGIRAAIRKAALIGAPADVAVAACRCAANPDMRTPALIAEPGPHWLGTSAGSRQAPTMCPTHPAHKAGGCPACIAGAVPKPDYVMAPPRTRSRDWTPKPVTADLTTVRAKADAALEPAGALADVALESVRAKADAALEESPS
jgi:hypothetical protein